MTLGIYNFIIVLDFFYLILFFFSGHKGALAEAVRRQQEAEKEKEAEELNLLDKLTKEKIEAEVEMANTLDKKFRYCHAY